MVSHAMPQNQVQSPGALTSTPRTSSLNAASQHQSYTANVLPSTTVKAAAVPAPAPAPAPTPASASIVTNTVQTHEPHVATVNGHLDNTKVMYINILFTQIRCVHILFDFINPSILNQTIGCCNLFRVDLV